jgi:hypothetical protein
VSVSTDEVPRPTWRYPSTLRVSFECQHFGSCARAESSDIASTSISIPSFSSWGLSLAMFGLLPLQRDHNPSFVYFQDPIILSGTAFLAYMTRAASNILNPRAWIHAQFSIANIASAILVSSNPTNLVLAGAFDIKFIVYTENMVSPFLVKLIPHS